MTDRRAPRPPSGRVSLAHTVRVIATVSLLAATVIWGVLFYEAQTRSATAADIARPAIERTVTTTHTTVAPPAPVTTRSS